MIWVTINGHVKCHIVTALCTVYRCCRQKPCNSILFNFECFFKGILSYNYRTNIMSSRVRTTAWLSFHHAQFQLNLAVLAHYWPKRKKVQNSFSKFYYRQPGWIRTDEVNRDRGGESRNGAWARRDTDKMSLPARARHPDTSLYWFTSSVPIHPCCRYILSF